MAQCAIEPTALDGVPAELARRRLSALKDDPAVFRDHLLIDYDGRSVPFGQVMDPWQREDFAALDNAWKRVAGKFDGECCNRAYLERPRGHSKTTDQACSALWVLFASERKITGIGAAAAKHQAGLLREEMDKLLRLNPWLAEEIQINKWEVVNRRTGSVLKILAADGSTTMGQTPDFAIVDELTHFKNDELWNSVFSAVAKRGKCVLMVIANAGFGMGISWQWNTREACRQDLDWYFRRLDGPSASWLTPKALAEQRRILLPTAYKRLWLNQWLTETGDALNMEDVARCCVLPGRPETNLQCSFAIGGLDLGISHDHAAFVVFGGDIVRRKLVLLEAVRWDPATFPNHRISLKAVEQDVLELCQRRGVLGVAYDPWQCVRTAEELESMGVRTFAYEFTSKTQDEMATTLIGAFTNDEIELWNHPSLMRDLSRLTITEKRLGHKLEAPRDELGHCDLATAFCIGLPWAVGTMKDYAPAAA